ncbi:MAG: outer membrane beta-barrel protein [Chitinophagaceae bacterium]|nr:outer membrane beta-barrel protein [Chitinophagaceae bacterium]
MENRVPIDDLFREKLSQGKEQLNLGAWANMERMLDGKNPYAQEDDSEKRKRRWLLPFIGILVLVSGLLTAGYQLMKPDHEPEKSEMAHLTPASAPASGSEKNNPAVAPASNSENLSTSTNNTEELKSSHSTSSHSTTSGNPSAHPLKSSGKKAYQQDLAKSETPQAESSIDNRTELNPSNASMAVEPKLIQETKLSKKELRKLAKLKKEAEAKKAAEALAMNHEAEEITKSQKKRTSRTTTTLNEKAAYNRDGSLKDLKFDTLGKINTTIETEEPVETIVANRTPVENPRFVKLSEEEEKNALYQATLPSKTAKAETMEKKVVSESVKTQKETHHSSFFKDINEFAKSTYEKINTASFNLLNMHLPMYPGLSVGVNAALFNNKNNFGGFQLGATNLVPVSRNLSILGELKFFYRNNSGYTVRDASTRVINQSMDNVTLANQNQTIYSYQVDSSARIYNFKNFYSLELPLMLQWHIRSISAYGGVNLAYNFKLKVNEINRKEVVNHADIVNNGTPYNYPGERSYLYARDDFSSRFGIGYTVGASYSFNPNIYLDLRMTQNVWDNTKTNTSREISNGFFKVPTIQLSLGYRFRKFNPDN